MLRGACWVAAVAVLAAGAFLAGTYADRMLGISTSVAHAQDAPVVTDRAAMINRQTVGEVLVNDEVVIRMRTSAGGFTAPERATIIATRVHRWLSGPYTPLDLAIRSTADGGAEVRAAGDLIVGVNPAEAAAIGSTPAGLARAWRNNIWMALGVQPPAQVAAAPPAEMVTDPEEIQQVEPTPPAPEGYTDSIVPIFSIGRGTRIGAARVNGPRDAVARVQGVTQLETRFRGFLVIDIYVPVTTEGGLDRVQRVGLTAIGDLGI